MSVIRKAMASGFSGEAGNTLYDVLKSLQSDIANHTHTENTGSAYVQNATTGAANAATVTTSVAAND